MPDSAAQPQDSNSPLYHGRWHPLILATGLGFSVLLLASFFLEPTRSLWLALDNRVFLVLNQSLAWSPWYRGLIAIATSPLVDVVGGLCMLGLYLHFVLRREHHVSLELTAIGLLMLLLLVVAVQLAKAIPYHRLSGTLVFTDALRLNELVTWIHSKDSSRDTFPGDHGTVLLVFAGMVSIYLPRAYVRAAWMIAAIFVAPRLVSGAHWFSDVAVGSVAIACLVLTVTFATPLHLFLVDRIQRQLLHIIPRRWLPHRA